MERVMQDGAEYSAWAEAGTEPAPRHVWAMGMVNCFFGINSVVFLLTIPQLLAERAARDLALWGTVAKGIQVE